MPWSHNPKRKIVIANHIVHPYETVCAAKVDLLTLPDLAVPVASPAFMALPDKSPSEAT